MWRMERTVPSLTEEPGGMMPAMALTSTVDTTMEGTTGLMTVASSVMERVPLLNEVYRNETQASSLEFVRTWAAQFFYIAKHRQLC